MPEFPTYEQLIGGTPLVNLNSMLSEEATARGVTLLGKAEFLNPGFSQKDRIARKIFDEAEESGALKPGGTVIAASSGNTGAAAAMMGAMRGYKGNRLGGAKPLSGTTQTSLRQLLRTYGDGFISLPTPWLPSSRDHCPLH